MKPFFTFYSKQISDCFPFLSGIPITFSYSMSSRFLEELKKCWNSEKECNDSMSHPNNKLHLKNLFDWCFFSKISTLKRAGKEGRYRQNARFNLLTTDILQMCRYIIQIGTDDVANPWMFFCDLGACKLELGNLRSLMITTRSLKKAKRLEFPFFSRVWNS